MLGERALIFLGSDRIARTAHSALGLLSSLRSESTLAFPLAWTPEVDGSAVIEVYPGATLRALGMPGGKYKAKFSAREVLTQRLEAAGLLQFEENGGRAATHQTDHGLDAALCVLAGRDFLAGACDGPGEVELARKEGWIWVRRPK